MENRIKKVELFYNCKAITMDGLESVQEAFIVEGDRFKEAGPARRLLQKYGDAAVRHDLKGKSVIPGINDCHAHPVDAALAEAESVIPVVRSVKEVLDWIKEQASKKPKGELIYIHRIFPTRLAELRLPFLQELDKAAPDHPVFLNGAFGGMVNSCLLGTAQITPETKHPGIVRDSRTGEPNGILHQSAYHLLKVTFEKEYSGPVQRELTVKMLSLYNSVGITSITATLWEKEDWFFLSKMAEDEALTVRIHCNYMPGWRKLLGSFKSSAEVEAAIRQVRFRTGSGDEWLRMGPFKTFVDGGILTATAYMLEPWSSRAAGIFGIADKAYRGNCNYTLEHLSQVVLAAVENGFSFIAHATGDGAVDLLVRAYEVVNKKIPLKGKGFQLLHGNFYTPEILDKCAAMGIVMDLQPVWLYKDVEALTELLGKKRMAHFHPWREMVDRGLLVCSGTDHMAKFDPYDSVNPYNPFYGLYALTTRKSEKGTVFQPEQALTRMEALRTYTLNGAIRSNEDKIKGSIEPGKLADFVVLEKDYLACSNEELHDMKVTATFVGGREVYRRGVL